MHKVEEKFFVAGQIFPSDIKSLKEQGFQTIVCNRPNGEEEGQPIYEEIEKTCKENDIKCFRELQKCVKELGNNYGDMMNDFIGKQY